MSEPSLDDIIAFSNHDVIQVPNGRISNIGKNEITIIIQDNQNISEITLTRIYSEVSEDIPVNYNGMQHSYWKIISIS